MKAGSPLHTAAHSAEVWTALQRPVAIICNHEQGNYTSADLEADGFPQVGRRQRIYPPHAVLVIALPSTCSSLRSSNAQPPCLLILSFLSPRQALALLKC